MRMNSPQQGLTLYYTLGFPLSNLQDNDQEVRRKSVWNPSFYFHSYVITQQLSMKWGWSM